MIDLRCDKHMHMRFDPDAGVLEVKCQQCTRETGKPIFHRWRLEDGKIAREPDDVRSTARPGTQTCVGGPNAA